MPNSKFMRAFSCLSVLLFMMSLSVKAAENKLLSQPADISHRAVHSVMLGVEQAGNRLVAVGERGFILLSDDEGKTWQQAEVPVSVTLTAVDFVSAKKGWVVGHGGVVLKTVDGGNHWEKILDGVKTAKIELAAAELAHDPESRRSKMRLREAKFSLKSGADKPFLDVNFKDENNGIIVGAYGLAFSTNDGGANWTSIMGEIPNTLGMHLYGIHAEGADTFFIGEQGSVFRQSENEGPFERVETPYEGSFFGMLESKNSDLILYGLRGHVFRSSDDGASWQSIPLPLPVTLSSGILLKDGGIVLTDETGQVLLSRDNGESFSRITVDKPSPFTDLIETPKGDIVLSGVRGTTRVSVNNLNKKVVGHD